MTLKTLLCIVSYTLIACGCTGTPEAVPRSAAAVERELDSVITRCRDSLRLNPADAKSHASLGRALLERAMRRERGYANLSWSDPGMYGVMLKDIGRPVDSIPAVNIPDTIKESFSHVTRALALNPDDAGAHRTMGRLYMTMGVGYPGDSMYAKATAEFDTSLLLDSASAESYYGLGCTFLLRNKPAAALAALNECVSLDSSIGPAYLTLGEAYMDTGNYAFAFACFENAARLGLTSTAEYFRLAGHYADDAVERRLLGRLATLRTQAPGFFKPVIRAGLRSLSMYHPAIALDLASRALGIDSACADAHLFRARVYIAEGDTESATDEFVEASVLGTAPFLSYSQFPQGMRERAYALHPGEDGLVYFLGGRSMIAGDSARTLAPFLQAARDRAANALPAFFVGEFFYAHRDTARALEWYDRVAALPRAAYPFMYWSIVRTYLEAGQIPKAVAAYERFSPREVAMWVMESATHSAMLERYGREKVLHAAACCAIGYECSWRIRRGPPGYWTARARELFHQAIEITPLSPAPYNALAALSVNTGNKTDAIRYYRKAAALGSSEAVEMLKQMGTKQHM